MEHLGVVFSYLNKGLSKTSSPLLNRSHSQLFDSAEFILQTICVPRGTVRSKLVYVGLLHSILVISAKVVLIEPSLPIFHFFLMFLVPQI